MTAPIVQAEYEQLKQIATKFGQLRDRVSSLQQQLNQLHQQLASSWHGDAFKAFEHEYTGEVVPALKRLENNFSVAQSVTGEISKIFRQAEEEAAGLFKDKIIAAAAAKKDEGGWLSKAWNKASDWVHGALDVVGFIPGFGEIADGVNALIYLAEGRHLEAAISAAAMIPIVGDAGKLGKWGVKAGKEIVEEIAEEGAERAVKEVAEEVVEEGAERVVKNVAEETLEETAERIPGIVANLPKNPDDLLKQGWKEVSDPDAVLHGHRTFEDPSGLTIRFDKGKPGAKGFEGVDHYHITNPHTTHKKVNKYLDRDGNPVHKGSDPSHIVVE
ncbi:WXG100 family type VII secretion target [Herpetosiphon giganteus]|uniref:WXG100 family type VII secretion target n=1 Tax=Herpetosiphon giganteus TaxID=2029754 RepID=UPI0019569B6A|nr:WXG100 family type VII secretion target [Herpetosiphon giganteus]MBM7844984.1 WXG100 family type VII secretion target [Herpetosiphon giganteus]